MKTTNPFNHPNPHAKLDTSIKRLSKAPEGRLPMVGDRSRDERKIYDQMLREKQQDRTG